MNRRSLIRGALTLFAAPAIVKLASIMPVKAMPRMSEADILRLIERKLHEAYEEVARGLKRELFEVGSDDGVLSVIDGIDRAVNPWWTNRRFVEVTLS